MCGRFSLDISPEILMEYFQLQSLPQIPPRYNIAPSQEVLVIRNNHHNIREAVMLRWGLIPSWLDLQNSSTKFINARVETADQRPIFRSAFKYRRCLIIASAFYEWRKLADNKQPYAIVEPKGQPFAFAGLWDHWVSGAGYVIESCTILTRDATANMTNIHSRMPVILPHTYFDEWLDIKFTDSRQIHKFINQPFKVGLKYYPVSKKVNNPSYDRADCLRPDGQGQL